ncbi:MAG: NIPSNAP family protein [Pedosphaera sp.]|nr:NIPSNAP family protein [Pedosphaera sp.]
MKTVCTLMLLLAAAPLLMAENDSRVFEMRIYYAAPGKLEAMHARFRDHTCKLFEKHGMTNIGYWVPEGENKEAKLVYVLAYPSREAREKSWKAFQNDSDWKTAYAASEKGGKLVAKAEVLFMSATDYSGAINAAVGKGPRVFELRTYTASKGNLGGLNARFRDHTLKLFSKHGMTNLFYWNLTKDQKNADSTLIYILAHASRDAAKASFDAFRLDPDWMAARKASEEKAGGSLTTPDGVKSEFLRATDYSTTR